MSSKSVIKFGFVMALKIVLIAAVLFIAVRLPGKSVVNYYGYSMELNTGLLVGGLIVCFLFFHYADEVFFSVEVEPRRRFVHDCV